MCIKHRNIFILFSKEVFHREVLQNTITGLWGIFLHNMGKNRNVFYIYGRLSMYNCDRHWDIKNVYITYELHAPKKIPGLFMKHWFLKTKLYFKKSRKNMEEVLAEKKPTIIQKLKPSNLPNYYNLITGFERLMGRHRLVFPELYCIFLYKVA